MKHILVVDDEPRIAEIARDYLERAGFTVTMAGNGADALTIARTRHPDLIVLDLGLPHVDGLDVTRTLRKQSNVPIIMLTARVDEGDKLAGLELGADDYVTKPFSPKELVARVRAVFRRIDVPPERGDVVRVGDVTLDKRRMQVTLARQPGRVFTRAQLLDAIRGVEAEAFDRAIDAHVKNVRRKLEPDPKHPRYVLTVHGVGYKFADD
jgi:two-component system, OmpR family, alkaline phosphatase synthesis response regulator PhoP